MGRRPKISVFINVFITDMRKKLTIHDFCKYIFLWLICLAGRWSSLFIENKTKTRRWKYDFLSLKAVIKSLISPVKRKIFAFSLNGLISDSELRITSYLNFKYCRQFYFNTIILNCLFAQKIHHVRYTFPEPYFLKMKYWNICFAFLV